MAAPRAALAAHSAHTPCTPRPSDDLHFRTGQRDPPAPPLATLTCSAESCTLNTWMLDRIWSVVNASACAPRAHHTTHAFFALDAKAARARRLLGSEG